MRWKDSKERRGQRGNGKKCQDQQALRMVLASSLFWLLKKLLLLVLCQRTFFFFNGTDSHAERHLQFWALVEGRGRGCCPLTWPMPSTAFCRWGPSKKLSFGIKR
jgi:hypothetical protein